MKISVITTCLNSARTVGHTLESFFRQDHTDKELIVVDRGSRDNTLDVVRSYESDCLRIISEPDETRYQSANKALSVSTGDAFGLLDSDAMFADHGALGSIADSLTAADIVFGNLGFAETHERPETVRRWRGSPYSKGAFQRGWLPAHATFYVRRPVTEALGNFDTRYRIAADYDFMLRALEVHDFRSVFVDKVLVNLIGGSEGGPGLKTVVTHNYEALRSRQQWLDVDMFDSSRWIGQARHPRTEPASFVEGGQRRAGGRQSDVAARARALPRRSALSQASVPLASDR